jgi:hypothetical protein
LVISVVHLVLDMLAFRSDVSFWRSRKGNYAGISSRSLLLSTLVRAVLFLYLLDQDASWLVLFSSGLSLAISVWKCAKILRLQVGCSARFPFLSVSLGGHHSASESLTAQHDAAAMKWLGMLAAPLVLGCTVWSLVYQSHKSWYSWGLSSCALAVHAGGFILMTPQLFVNYKLKSVAHLPLRVFIYRACNTFIGAEWRCETALRVAATRCGAWHNSWATFPPLQLAFSPSSLFCRASFVSPLSPSAPARPRPQTTFSRSSSRCRPCTDWPASATT